MNCEVLCEVWVTSSSWLEVQSPSRCGAQWPWLRAYKSPRGAVRALGIGDTGWSELFSGRYLQDFGMMPPCIEAQIRNYDRAGKRPSPHFCMGHRIPWGASLERECCVFRCLMGSSALGILRGGARRAPAVGGNGQESWGVPNASSSFWVREGKERPERACMGLFSSQRGRCCGSCTFLSLTIHPSIYHLFVIYHLSLYHFYHVYIIYAKLTL